MKIGRCLSAVFVLAILAGCAGPSTLRPPVSATATAREAQLQHELAVKTALDRQIRLYRVSERISLAASSFCGGYVVPRLGFMMMAPQLFNDTETARIASEHLKLGNTPHIVAVAQSGPADQAGFKVGDELLAVNDASMSVVGSDFQEWFAEQVRQASEANKSTKLRVRRGTEELALEVQPSFGCAYPIRVVDGDAINAYADGASVNITMGMMRFAQDDNELALVVGHELAHNTQGHLSKRRKNRIAGSVADVLISVLARTNTQGAFANASGLAYSQEFEAEADYVGLYMIARAGYDIDTAPSFWRRMAVEYPASIKQSHSATHPSSPNRFVALEQTAAEIHDLQSSGAELAPRTK